MASFSNEILVATGADDVREVATADMNGDGRLDLLSASFGDDTIAWYENLGPPAPGLPVPGLSFSARQTITTNAVGAVAVEAADLDDDGDRDAVSVSFDDSKLAWYENMGGGSFGPQQVITTAGNLPADTDAADLDNDGDIDLALISNFGLLWAENVSAGFQINQIAQGQSVIDGGFAVHAADLDDDGDPDLLTIASRDGKVAWHENMGGGNFGTQQVITTNAPSGADVHAADLDQDGDLDVLSASGDGPEDRIAWYENMGGGSFGAQQVISTEQGAPSAVQAADLDLDGDPDLVTAAVADDRIAQFENMGGGSFGPFQSLTNDADEAADVSLADLDGDGDVDVAQASRGDSTVSVFQNQTLQDAVNRISFKFGEFGGNLNMEVNGDFRNFANFQDVAGATIGGAGVAVTNGFGNDTGTVTLSGTAIDQFRIGGQELWLDDIEFGNAANPAATVTFASLQPMQPEYNPGDSFATAAGVDVAVQDFIFFDGTPFGDGLGQTANAQMAGGTGQDFNTNNVTLDFDVESAVTGEALVIPDPPDGTGDSWGDPHLVTFDGLAYDFQAAGEFTLVSSDDGSLSVQVRQEPIGGRPVAVNTAVATEIGGTRVGLYAGQDNPLEIDNQTVALDVTETMAVGNGAVSRNEGRFTIALPGEDGQLNDGDPQLIVDVFGNHLDVEVRVPDSLSDELSGLLGDFDGDPNNDPQFPDGDPLCDPRFCDPPNPTFPTGILYEEFADSHRVGDQASLFNYEQGESNQGFQMPDFPGEAFTADDLDPDVRDQAEMAAENAGLEPGTTAFDNAVLDFGVTQDNSFFSGALGAPTPAIAASFTSLGGIDVFPTDGLATSEAGGTDTFDVVLTRQPSDDVTITVASDDTSEGTASPNTLVFTPNNFDTPQTVTVTGVDDTIPDGDQQYAVVTAPAMSNDPSFNGLDPFDVVLMNFDDEDFVVEIPPPPVNIGDSWGDPHLVTFDGLAYDFQAAGEFTLALSDAGDVNIQVRQEPIGDRPVSVNTAVATEIGGTRVGLYLGQDNPLEIGNDTIGLEDGEVMAVGNGAVSRDGNTFTIVLPGEVGQLNDGDPGRRDQRAAGRPGRRSRQ
ncbi:MAG: hypothetical protein GVY13_09195 [Alphaproteobacteria bacterium]|jgi:major membrane immunogen (membrane-anchored lipoprotein)|nr:hypothetical protein [Alphaproteobacteria bacterium]